jgi:uncharacterized protein
MNTDRADRLFTSWRLTPSEWEHIRSLGRQDRASLLSAAYAATLKNVDDADEIVARMLGEIREVAPCDS